MRLKGSLKIYSSLKLGLRKPVNGPLMALGSETASLTTVTMARGTQSMRPTHKAMPT